MPLQITEILEVKEIAREIVKEEIEAISKGLKQIAKQLKVEIEFLEAKMEKAQAPPARVEHQNQVRRRFLKIVN